MSNAVTVPADKLAELQREAARYRWLRTRRVVHAMLGTLMDCGFDAKHVHQVLGEYGFVYHGKRALAEREYQSWLVELRTPKAGVALPLARSTVCEHQCAEEQVGGTRCKIVCGVVEPTPMGAAGVAIPPPAWKPPPYPATPTEREALAKRQAALGVARPYACPYCDQREGYAHGEWCRGAGTMVKRPAGVGGNDAA